MAHRAIDVRVPAAAFLVGGGSGVTHADQHQTVLDAGHPALVQREPRDGANRARKRSEEHTSELQSQSNLVCRLLLEKKNTSNLQSQSNVATRLLLALTIALISSARTYPAPCSTDAKPSSIAVSCVTIRPLRNHAHLA